tara:strand:- start:152 stop:478 length:327 start_codon:yes stop_codon:yes gene_type:complete
MTIQTVDILAIRNSFEMFKRIYNNETIKERRPERHQQLPLILAVFAVYLNDTDLVDYIITNYGINCFTEILSPWSVNILRLFNINFFSSQERPDSPTSITQINSQLLQ